MDVLLKRLVKSFFIEKDVTSTLMMDTLYSGLKALEGQTKNNKAMPSLLDSKALSAPVVTVDKDMFVLADDVLTLLERASLQPLPLKDEKYLQNRKKVWR
uniref:MATH domain-containing protein n=1 Tax=Noccaea caerulescens TaxID=107243 RepID=A0A1J3IYI6_NOCCA